MPDWRKEIQKYIAGLDLDPTRETEIVEELNQHLNDMYEELLKSGKTTEQAYAAAIEELNGGKLDAELRVVLKPARPSIELGEPSKGNRSRL